MGNAPPDVRDVLICALDEVRLGLDVNGVERVVRAARLTPVPNPPPNVEGLLRVGSRIVPVVCLRKRLGLPAREISPADRLVLLQTGLGPLGLRVDEVEGVAGVSPDRVVALGEALFGKDPLEVFAGGDAGLILIQDTGRLLAESDRLRLSERTGEGP